MSPFKNALRDTTELHVGIADQHINETDRETFRPREADQFPILPGRKHCLDANCLVNGDRGEKPGFDPHKRRKVGAAQVKLLNLHNSGGQQIGIDDPDRATPVFNVGPIVGSAFA